MAPSRSAGVVVTVVAALLAAACLGPVAPDADDADLAALGAAARAADPLHERVLAELDAYVTWLGTHDVDGYVGEVGWPAGGGDTDRWNELGAAWLDAAQDAGLWVTVWGAGTWWGTEYRLSPYVASDGRAIDAPAPQAGTIGAGTGGPPLGVNVSGAEFGAPGGSETHSTFSNERPGEYGTDYTYEDPASLRYLAGRGLTLVRLPLRWERLQRQPYGPLDAGELARLHATVDHADAAGLGVVLDVHNYGGYFLADDRGGGVRRPIGSPQLPISAFADLWRRLSAEFGGQEGIAAYGLMNEPHALAGSPAASAQRWERASQAAVDAIRGRGDATLVMVPGANWSNTAGWADTHPAPWIEDPTGNVRYEAHHYFDSDRSGRYEADYATERSRAATGGQPGP